VIILMVLDHLSGRIDTRLGPYDISVGRSVSRSVCQSVCYAVIPLLIFKTAQHKA
jgi:hypothetical protein